MAETLYTRHAESRVREALEDFPVVLIQGARQCGKTTLARMVGEAAGYAYINFDNPALYQGVEEDPAGFVDELPERVILDEVQKVPRLFSVIKLSVDRNRIPGRFILTGSASVLLMRQITDSLAGRMAIVNLHPFSQCEIEQIEPAFLDRLFRGDFKIHPKRMTKGEIAGRVAKGGYPSAIRISSARKRMVWHSSYVESLIHRDVPDISRIRSVNALSRLLLLCAAETAQLCNTDNLARSFQLSRPTIHDYLTVLEISFMIRKLPAWHSRHARRLVKAPKLHLNDTGLACALTGLSPTTLVEDGRLYGSFLETFVVQELHRQESGHPWRHTFSHYRDRDGAEVDLVMERGQEALAAVEVKASATVRKSDFRGLHRLKNAAGRRFRCGVVLYAGETSLPFGDRLYAVPLRLLWEQDGALGHTLS